MFLNDNHFDNSYIRRADLLDSHIDFILHTFMHQHFVYIRKESEAVVFILF